MIDPRVYIYGAILVAVVSVSGGVGYKVGAWQQAAADSSALQEAAALTAASANAIAEAEKVGRQAAASIYTEEIRKMRERAVEDARLVETLRVNAATTQSKYARAQRTIQELKNEPDVETFRSTPVPRALRERLLKDFGADNAASGGDN